MSRIFSMVFYQNDPVITAGFRITANVKKKSAESNILQPNWVEYDFGDA
jgi:hypothetical protein